MSDKYVNPKHYNRCKIQPVEYCFQNDLPGWAWSVVKYITRAGHKDYDGDDVASEVHDLRKAQRFIQMQINWLERQDPLDDGNDTSDQKGNEDYVEICKQCYWGPRDCFVESEYRDYPRPCSECGTDVHLLFRVVR